MICSAQGGAAGNSNVNVYFTGGNIDVATWGGNALAYGIQADSYGTGLQKGVQADLAIARMRTGMPVRFRPAEGGVRLEGAVIDCDSSGRATACEPLRVEE